MDLCFTELSLTVPITNSLAFLFTVLGEWWAEGKVISRGKAFLSVSLLRQPWLILSRYLDWYGICSRWNCTLRAVKEHLTRCSSNVKDLPLCLLYSRESHATQ